MTFTTVTATDLSMPGLIIRKFFDIDKTTGYAGIWFSKVNSDGTAVNQLVKFTYNPYMFDSDDPLYFSTIRFDQCVYLYDLSYNPDSEVPQIAQYDLMVCIGDKTPTPNGKLQKDTWPKAVYVYQIVKDEWKLAANKIYLSSDLEYLCPVSLTMKSFDHNFLMTSRCPGDSRTSVVGIYLDPDTLDIDYIDRPGKIQFDIDHNEYTIFNRFEKKEFMVIDKKNKEIFGFRNSYEKYYMYWDLATNEKLEKILEMNYNYKTGLVVMNL